MNIAEIGRILKIQFSLLEHSFVKISEKRLTKGKLDEIKPLGSYVVGSVEPAPAAHHTQHIWKVHTLPGCSLCLGFPPGELCFLGLLK